MFGVGYRRARLSPLTAIVGEKYLDDALNGGDADVGGVTALREGHVVHLGPGDPRQRHRRQAEEAAVDVDGLTGIVHAYENHKITEWRKQRFRYTT